MNPVVAQAIPHLPRTPAQCNQWGFTVGGNGFALTNSHQTLLFQAGGTELYQAPATLTGADTKALSGYLNGSIHGATLNAPWNSDSTNDQETYNGIVDAGRNLAGTVSFSNGGNRPFTGTAKMVCQDKPAAQAPPPPAAPAPAPAQVFTNAITASFDNTREKVFSMTVNNSSPLPASCKYEAKSLNPLAPSDTTRTFNVAANGSDTETFNGLKTFSKYKITVTCTDSSGKQSQPLGSVNQTVTW